MLELSLKLYQFYRNIDVEIKWTQTKIAAIDSETLGDSVTGVQRKQKAHANLQVPKKIHAFSFLFRGVAVLILFSSRGVCNIVCLIHASPISIRGFTSLRSQHDKRL
jgi:hypothetical protein